MPRASNVDEPRSVNRGRARRVVAVSAGGVGVATLATGLVFGALAKNKWDNSRDHCDEQGLCSPLGARLTETAVMRATVSTVLVSAGLIAIGAGTVLYLTSPNETAERKISVHPTLKTDARGNTGIGITARGRF